MFSKSNPQTSSKPGKKAPRPNGAAPAQAQRPKTGQPAPARARTPSVPSILGRDITITGDIKTDGDVQVDGRLDGNIKAGSLTVGESGAVNGKIIAGTVHVRGKVTGKIEANVVDLSDTANVQADLVQDQLTIANGAFFDGKCSRKTPTPAPVKSAAPKA